MYRTEKFICDNCEHNNPAFDETHAKMHCVVVRVTEEAEKGRSTEERLQFLEDELAKVRQSLEMLVEKGGKEVSQ